MPSYVIRRCLPGDAAVVAEHRVAMFRDMGDVPSDDLAGRLLAASIPMLAADLEQGTYVGWFAVSASEQVIAGVGAHVKPSLPRITRGDLRIASSPVPLVVNVYTHPEWRRQGVARALMTTLMNWATAKGFDRVVLHASDAGRPLYASLGFVPTNEMRWTPPLSDELG